MKMVIPAFLLMHSLVTRQLGQDLSKNLLNDGNGYLSFNFRGQKESKFDINLDLDEDLIVSDLINLIKFVNPKNVVLIGLSIGGLYAAKAIKKV